jgi:adenosine deaminase
MFQRHSIRMFMTSVRTFVLALTCALAVTAGAQTAATSSTPNSSEEKTARDFETMRKSPAQLWKFLLKMPKGADLHNHLSGAIYAESYIQWAAEKGLCVNNDNMALRVPPTKSACDPNTQRPASAALTNSVFYQQLIDAWSMRNWQLSGDSGHDHFFNAFGKFSPATYDETGRMMAEAASRAAHGNVLYLELMLTPDGVPDGVVSTKIGDQSLIQI